MCKVHRHHDLDRENYVNNSWWECSWIFMCIVILCSLWSQWKGSPWWFFFFTSCFQKRIASLRFSATPWGKIFVHITTKIKKKYKYGNTFLFPSSDVWKCWCPLKSHNLCRKQMLVVTSAFDLCFIQYILLFPKCSVTKTQIGRSVKIGS